MTQDPNAVSQLLTLPGTDDAGDIDLGETPPPWWRRRRTIIWISVALLVILLGGLLFTLLNRKPPVRYQYQRVQRGNLALTISATGPLSSAVYNLVFNGQSSGIIIDEIDVKVGQKVVAGQVVAKLNRTSLLDVYNEQSAAVSAAQKNLNSAMNELLKAEGLTNANISAAQTSLNNSQSSLNTTQALSQANISAAQTTLSNDQASLAQIQNQAQANISAAQTTLSNDQASLARIQSESQANISAAQTTLNNAQQSLNQAMTVANAQIAQALQQEQSDIQACQSGANLPTPTPTSQTCIQLAMAKYNQAVASANANVQTAQNAVNTAQQSLNQARATANSNNQAAQAKVNADQQALNQARATANANIQTAQAKVTADQQALNQAIANANQSNTTAQGQVNTNRAGINTSQASGASSIASAQQAVITDQGMLYSALTLLAADKHNLDNSILKAPHTGVITVVNGTVGGAPGLPQNASTSSTTTSGNTFIQIVDTSNLQVQASVNETDTANLKLGESATFTVNAYPNKIFLGTVGSISPLGQTVSNVVTYPVYIDIDMNSVDGANLIPGMTANVMITVVRHSDVLLIPVSAVDFARLASSNTATSGTPQLISSEVATTAMIAARQMLINLQQSQPEISAESPTPAYVIESPSSGKFIAKPVVLGLTEGTQYEVLEGLTTADTVVVGTVPNGPGGANTNAGPGGGG